MKRFRVGEENWTPGAVRLRTTYITLVSLILVLSLYLGLRTGDRVHYQIPALPALTDIDEITVEQPGNRLEFTVSGGIWRIQPEGYAVNRDSLDFMLEALKNPQITDLVSVTGNYGVYDLDESARIRVSAYNDGELVRSVDIGKRSSAHDHTYIKLVDDDRVFQIAGDYRGLFGNTKDAFRDKTVLSFDVRAITSIRVTDSEGVLWLERDDADSPWKTRDGTTWDTADVNAALVTLSSLKAYSYRDANDTDGVHVFTIELNGEGKNTVTFYEKRGVVYPVRSSQSTYPFTLFFALSEFIMDAFRE